MPDGPDDSAVVAARLRAQLLSGRPAGSVEGAVRRLLAVQAQDPRGARLSVRPRTSGLTASDVDDALTASRSLVVTTLNRGTLHLVAAEDYWWLHPITAPRLVAANRRRLRQEGVSPTQAERGVAVVAQAVTSDGPQTRAQLRARLEGHRVPTGGQALAQLLYAATLGGHVVRGPMVGADQAYVSVAAWLGPAPPALDGAAALARLARRYLEGHGPATAADLARWAGITLGDARLGFDAVAGELRPIPGRAAGDGRPAAELTGSAGLFRLAGRADSPARWPRPRLLGPFEPILHGWASREPLVGRHQGVVTTNGIFRPIALVDGRVVATWGLPAGRVTLRPLEPISDDRLEALAVDASDVLRFLRLPDTPMVVT